MKLGIFNNAASPTTDVYRTIHPFRLLLPNVEVLDPTKTTWDQLSSCDAVLVSRPNGSHMVGLLTEFKRMGVSKKIIVDMDDLLHELDPANPSYAHFNSEEVKGTVAACLNLADHVIYSTRFLQEYYKPMHPNVASSVVPNAVDFDITPIQEPKPIHNPVRVLWRGSEHHKADLETIRPFWNWILKEPGFQVLFMGLQPHDVATYFPGARCIPWQPSPFQYWQGLAKLEADFAIFPLEGTNFNYAKSNIFSLEMLTAGVMPIVTDGFPEFEHPGISTFHDSQDIIDYLRQPFQVRDQLIYSGQEWLRENRDLKVINRLRKPIIQSLFDLHEGRLFKS